MDSLKPVAGQIVRDAARALPHLHYGDVRVEITEAKAAAAENGGTRIRHDDGLALGVRVLAGDRGVAPGYVGLALGAADVDALPRLVREALERAYRRALANAEMKADTREKLGVLGEALADTRLHPIDVRQDTVAAVYEIDPRSMDLVRRWPTPPTCRVRSPPSTPASRTTTSPR